MRRHALQVVIGAMLVAASACSSTAAFARLESAVVNDRYAGSPTVANVRVVRGASVVSPSISMRLLKGDSIATSPTSRAVITFAAGYEVSLDTNTAIYIENPSIFLRIGQAFIRKLLGTRADTARLDTHTPQATLHDAGTEYLVTVSGEGTEVRVVSGAVDASSRDGRWPGIRYSAGQQGRMTSQGVRVPMPPLTQREIDARLAWVRRVERITKVPVPRVDSMTERDARSTLDRAGFRVMFVLHRETDAIEPGRVVEQSPGAGALEAPGTFVTLTLSKPPRGAQQPTCTVPDLYRKSDVDAKRTLEGARLLGQATRGDSNGSRVVAQNPKKDSRVPCGSTVTYTLGTIVE